MLYSDSNGKTVKVDLATQIGHFSTAETIDDLEFTEEQETITPQQRSYCALRVRGFSSAAACRQIKVNPNVASRWANSGWFTSVCEEERKLWFESSGVDIKRDLMIPLVGQAVDALSQSLHSEDEKVRLGAVSLVFETFFDGKKAGPGRPVIVKKPDEQRGTELSDILSMAQDRIINMSERIGNLTDVNIRANGTE